MQNLRKLIGPISIETNSREYKIKFTGGSRNFTNIFTTPQCSRHYFYNMLSARALNHHLVLIWTLISVKTVNFKVIIVIWYKKSIKCSFISPWEVIERANIQRTSYDYKKKGKYQQKKNFGQKGQWSCKNHKLVSNSKKMFNFPMEPTMTFWFKKKTSPLKCANLYKSQACYEIS